MTIASSVQPKSTKPAHPILQFPPSVSVSEELQIARHHRLDGQRMLVTGGEGFIGSHLTESLVAAGAIVTVVDRVPFGEIQNLKHLLGQFEYRQGELLQLDFDELLGSQDFRAVFHFAGSASVPGSVDHPWDDFQWNVVATLKLLESLRRNHPSVRLILASSAAVYGNTNVATISEETPIAPISPYGVSKLTTERYAAVYATVYGLRTASLRPFAIYGPRLRKQVIYDFIRKLSEDPRSLNAHGDGTQVRDFCYISDVVTATLAVERDGEMRGEVYNVASGIGSSIQSILDRLCKRLGIAPSIQWSGAVRPGEPQHWIADISRLKSLGWNPSVSLDVGLQLTLEWFQNHHR